MTMRFRLFLLLSLALALSCWHCGRRAATFESANVILISLDTLRSDHLPIYGYDLMETPAIDALAGDGLVYERAYSQYPLTLPAHATLFTGRLPGIHGVRENGSVLGPEWETLTSTLKDRGYHTAAFLSSAVLSRRTGLDRGFDLYEDQLRPGGADPAAALVVELHEAVDVEPKITTREQFQALLSPLKGRLLLSLCERHGLRLSGTKDVRISTLWSSHLVL